jgi:hypothetical protein
MSKNTVRWTEEEYAAVLANGTQDLGNIQILRRSQMFKVPLSAGIHHGNQIAVKQETKTRRGDPEHQEQAQFIAELEALAKRDRRYALAVHRTYAIPNGGHKSKRVRGRHKAEGLKSSVPDLFVSLPVNDFSGCYIEMKSLTGDPDRDQRKWLNESIDLGYMAACCRGWKQAMIVWLAYVDPSL